MKIAIDAVAPAAGRERQLHVPHIMVPGPIPPMAGTSPRPGRPADRGGNAGKKEMEWPAISYLNMRFFGRPVDAKQIFFRLCSGFLFSPGSSFRKRQN